MPNGKDQWGPIEERVLEAEKAERQRVARTREIKKRTGISRPERKNPARQTDEKKQYDIDTESRVMKKALTQEANLETQIELILGREGSEERVMVDFMKGELKEALRANALVLRKIGQLSQEETDILTSIEGAPSEAEQDALTEIRSELDSLYAEHDELYSKSPEAFFGLTLLELLDYKRELGQGRIVETPYVEKQAHDIAAHLRASKPVFIYGHLGTGKTELAMHVARKYLDKEALVISGSKNMSLAELYGHQVLALDKIKKQELDQFVTEVEDKFTEWQEKNPEASSEDRNRAHDRILQTYLTQMKSGTISDFFLGPVYQAMEEGRPVIIDEVNAIPHQVLISLNHILTRRTGDIVNVQQDSGKQVTVQEGYGVIMTGNLNQGAERYVDREDMDPAFLSRVYKVEHDYLPQTTEGRLDEAGAGDELFHLLLARVMDKNGNATVPQGSMEKLWNLAKAARITEDVFAGRQVQKAFYFREAGAKSTPYALQEGVLSLRGLDAIVSQWQQEGYKHELDYYLYKEFVSQSTVASDRAYLYQLLKDQFGFFKSTGWEQKPDYGSGGVVSSFAVEVPKNPSAPSTFYGPRELVQFAFGEAPERTEWPEMPKIEEDEGFDEEFTRVLMELERYKDSELIPRFKKLEEQVARVCEREKQGAAV